MAHTEVDHLLLACKVAERMEGALQAPQTVHVKPDILKKVLETLIRERDEARAGIAKVFQSIERGDLDPVHWESANDRSVCPDDDTCVCTIKRTLLEVQIAGAIDADKARYLLSEMPAPGPHDRADCPCDHPPCEVGVCAGCNCADEPPLTSVAQS